MQGDLIVYLKTVVLFIILLTSFSIYKASTKVYITSLHISKDPKTRGKTWVTSRKLGKKCQPCCTLNLRLVTKYNIARL